MFFSGSYYFVCQGIKEIKPVPDWTWPGLQARTTLRQSGESGTSRRPQNEWFWRRWQFWWGYWWCIKEIQTVPDCLRPGLQTETTWRPGWPHQERQEHQEDPRMGDIGWDGSLDGVLSRYQGYSTCSGFSMTRATNWDHLDPIKNIRNFKKTPGWKTLEERAVLMGLLSGYQEDSTCSGLLEARITNWDHLETWLTPSGTSRRPQVGWFWLRRQSWWGIVKVSRIFNLFWILHD